MLGSLFPESQVEEAKEKDKKTCKKRKEKFYARRKTKEREIRVGDEVLMKDEKYSKKVPFDLNPLKVMKSKEGQITMERKGKTYKMNQNKVVRLPKRPVHLQTGCEDSNKDLEVESDSDVDLNMMDTADVVMIPVPILREEVDVDVWQWEEMLDSDDSEGGWVAVRGKEEEEGENEAEENGNGMETSADVEEDYESAREEEIEEHDDVLEEDVNDCAARVCKRPVFSKSEKKLRWVGCSVCDSWVHYPCLKLSQKEIKELDRSYTKYVCERCGGEKVEIDDYSRLSPRQKGERKKLARL